MRAENHMPGTVGTIMALCAALCLAANGTAVFAGKGTIPATELLFFRFVLSSILLGTIERKKLPVLFSRDAAAIWLVAVAGAVSASCLYATLQMMPVSTAFLLADMSLILIVPLSAHLLGERPGVRGVCGVAGMAAALVILNIDDVASPGTGPLLVGMVGAIALAVCSVGLRAAAKKHSPGVIVFAYGLSTAIIVPFFPSDQWVSPWTYRSSILIAICFVTGTASNILYTAASRHLQAGVVAVVTKSSLLWAAFIAMWLYESSPRSLEWAAYVTALISVVLAQEIKLPRGVRCLLVERNKSSSWNENDAHTFRDIATSFSHSSSSCVCLCHMDSGTPDVFESDLMDLFRELKAASVESNRTALVAAFPSAGSIAVVLDSEITTAVGSRKVRLLHEAMQAIDSPDFIGHISESVSVLSRWLCQHFPPPMVD